MVRLFAGIVIGFVIGLSASGFAATCAGYGDLDGWTVSVNGEEICSDPSIDIADKSIECQ